RVLAADGHVASRREKREAKIKRILLQLRGVLVDEAFAQRAPVNVHAAPRRRLQQLQPAEILEVVAQIRNVVRHARQSGIGVLSGPSVGANLLLMEGVQTI